MLCSASLVPRMSSFSSFTKICLRSTATRSGSLSIGGTFSRGIVSRPGRNGSFIIAIMILRIRSCGCGIVSRNAHSSKTQDSGLITSEKIMISCSLTLQLLLYVRICSCVRSLCLLIS